MVIITAVILILIPKLLVECKIFDFHSDNSLFPPFIQKISNYRTQDYLIKLLKRNLEGKYRKCLCPRKPKQCLEYGRPRPKDFICEAEGTFPNPYNCRQFYICFRSEMPPIEVTCPRGFAFDSEDRKCTRRRMARHYRRNRTYGNL